jgi:class 3 adenylate cyclase
MAGSRPRTATDLTERVRWIALWAVIAAVLVISVIALRNALTWVDKPFSGFLVNERMVLGNLGQYHWSGTRAGLRYPDRIIAADGRPVSSMRDLQHVVRARPIGSPVTYAVDREGHVIELTIPTMRFTWLDLGMTFGITCLAGLTYLLMGTLVVLMKPDARVSWVFLLASALLSVFIATSFDIQSTHAGFVRMYLAASAFFPAGFAHLGLIFPERRRLVDAFPLVELAPYLVSIALVIPLESLYPRPEFVSVYLWVRLYAIVGGMVVVLSAAHAYATTSSPLARQRARVVLIGAGLGFPIPAVAYYLSLFGGELFRVTIQNNFLALPIMIFPASVAYAVARHNLFDVDVYLKRAAGYAIMTALVSAAYVSVQMLTRRMILEPVFGELADTVYPFGFAILVVFLFHPIQRRVQEVVDRIWFRAESDYKKTITAVSGALRSMLDREGIMRQVAHTAREGMFVDSAGVIVVEPGGAECDALFVREGEAERRSHVSKDDPLVVLMSREKRLVTRYELEEEARYADVRERCLRRFAEMGATLALPLVYQGEVTGVVVLGEKKSGRFYSRSEVDLLTTMADQAAVAIENASSHAKVVAYAGELAASLRRIEMLESMKASLVKFVPKTVQELIERSPEAPSLEKREVDVSVVFADITGYTRLTSSMAFDRVNELVEHYFGSFLDEILKYGGDINETAGDGLMVIFQDEDKRGHARAAVGAALGIQRRTREINAQLGDRSEPIAMHVGVNSGMASVGATKIEAAAGTRWTYTASGFTTNVAARLAELAGGGEVIVSAETWRRLGDEFDAEDLGFQALRNVAEKVRAYRLRG